MTSSSIRDEYVRTHPRSRALFAEAENVIAGGITHDMRHLNPFPIYVTHGLGAHKWDVDGLHYVDYWVGHGALLLGHSQPAVIAAVSEMLPKMSHPGACTELEVRWAEQVQKMVPSAQRVKFVSSGTEATMLAMRVARAFTGKSKVVRFRGHFHGWHDYALTGYLSPYDVPSSAGIPREVQDTMPQADTNNLDQVASLLEGAHDVAAVILEPGGGHNGAVPPKPGFLKGLREITRAKGVVLIFDEVISGFRFAPGGAQQRYGVTPDVTTLGKIVAGGLPGGAVAGSADVMSVLGFRDGDARWSRYGRVLHQGTYNANPLSAAAGITMLKMIADGAAQCKAEETTAALVRGFNRVIQEHGLPGCAYHGSSVWHMLPAVKCPYRDGCNFVDCQMDNETLFAGMGKAQGLFRLSMINQGVDTRAVGWVSAAHSAEDVAFTVNALDATLQHMQQEGAI